MPRRKLSFPVIEPGVKYVIYLLPFIYQELNPWNPLVYLFKHPLSPITIPARELSAGLKHYDVIFNFVNIKQMQLLDWVSGSTTYYYMYVEVKRNRPVPNFTVLAHTDLLTHMVRSPFINTLINLELANNFQLRAKELDLGTFYSYDEMLGFNDKISRVSVVFSLPDTQLILARKGESGKLTDIGGGCSTSRGENWLNCLDRELSEELGFTKQDFDHLDLKTGRYYAVKTKRESYFIMIILPINTLTLPTLEPNGELSQLVTLPVNALWDMALTELEPYTLRMLMARLHQRGDSSQLLV